MNRLAWRAEICAADCRSDLVLLPLVGLAGCNRRSRRMWPRSRSRPRSFSSLPQVRQVTDHEDFTGNTQAIKTVQIRARVSGYLDKVNFTEGAIVNKGDVLCEVDPRPYQAAYDSAVGQVHLNEAILKQAKADNARAKGLADTPGAISQQDRDKYEATEEQAKATLETSNANMETAKLNLDVHQGDRPLHRANQPAIGRSGQSCRRRHHAADDARHRRSDLRASFSSTNTRCSASAA